MFAYIQNHTQLTESMLNEYRNSMIFLGDQKQIFVPVINSYVGLGTDAYTYILNKLNDGKDNLQRLYDNINNNNVTSIYAQYSPKDFNDNNVNSGQTVITGPINNNVTIDHSLSTRTADINQKLQAKRNVVIRGLHDNDIIFSHYGTVNPKSGINVTIQHQGGNYLSGTDADGHSFSYYDPEHDVILIDDTRTWTYIAEQSSYMIDFASKFATQQANRVYHDLLGDSEVYIEKEFNEVFIQGDGGTIEAIDTVYVKLANGNYAETRIQNGKIQAYNGTSWIDIYNLSTNTIIDTTPNSQFAGIGGTESVPDPSNPSNSVKVPVWYQKDSAVTSTYNMNLVDGINSIKEVAYILDKITDGTDGGYDTGIQLAYSIAKNHDDIQDLKAWQANIGSSAVRSFESESNNTLITVDSYSKDFYDHDNPATGQVKLEVDLVLAQTYTLTMNNQNVSYVAYLNHADHTLANYANYYKKVEDETSSSNYYKISDVLNSNSDIHKKLVEYYGDLSNPNAKFNIYTLQSGEYNANGQTNITYSGLNNANINSNNYIYWPYKRIFDNSVTTGQLVKNGLTTVEWVTTYVGWAAYDIINRVSNVNQATQEAIQNAINALDYTDTPQDGYYVKKVDEVDGVISVTREKLPLDKILSDHVFTSGNIYIPVSLAQAQDFWDNNISGANIAKLIIINNQGQYIASTSNTPRPTTDSDIYRIKVDNISNFNAITSSVPVSDLITNTGKLTYFYKVASGNVEQYIPLDVQTAYTSNTPNDIFTVTSGVGKTVANKVFYLNSSTSQQFNKYISAFTHQNADGSTTTSVTAYISYLAASSSTRTGLADAWDVRRTIESMFTWVDIKSNKVIK